MKKFLFIALLFPVLTGNAQSEGANVNCKAFFKYEVNPDIKTLVPATAITFYDRSEGKVMEWYWDFGEGSTSREQNPTFIFNHPVAGPNVKINPYRTVNLTILTADSCKSFYSEVINIMEGTGEVPLCRAGFKYYQTAYDSVRGTASFQLTNLAEGESLSYFWQFDNGQTSTEREPAVTFDIKPGKHQVCLTVSGANQCSDTFCDAIYVYNPDKPVTDPGTVDCQTYFWYSVNYNVQTFAPALVLDFRTKSYPDAVEWKWDFGDGSTSNEPAPTHIFNFPVLQDSTVAFPNPFRKVCLTVKSSTGCEAVWCETINIYMEKIPQEKPGCEAWFKYQRATDVIIIPEVVAYRLSDVSEGEVTKRLWNFEDGTTSTEKEPIVTFDMFKPSQKVCLDIYTADGCTSTWCETIYVSAAKTDTGTVYNPECPYIMRYSASFPPQVSSCAGTAKAQVYLKDSPVDALHYVWSTGEEEQEVKGLCPTRTYSVKATIPDGCVVSGTFIFNSDGTVTEVPVNWWVSGNRGSQVVEYQLNNPDYTVEWRLCDGTVVKSDSIPLNMVNCNSGEPNLVLKDATGNIIYSEKIEINDFGTGIDPVQSASSVKLFPNPANTTLNIRYSGNHINEIQVEILDMNGKQIICQEFFNIDSGQQFSIHVGTLKKGMYLCKISADQKVITTEKFSK
ncbi:MAG: PKD domain-containing protein [Prolixibacteraceae bacterium]|jgi:PKD repeat protein|nr:PKD domain-containing protein [Prolixibacteraceae bacterium]